MNLDNLEKVLEKEPKYRLKQAKDAVFKNFISDWSEATFFTKDLRDKLNKECPLGIEADVLVSRKEDSVKARITLKDGLKIETVLMRHEDGRNTITFILSSYIKMPGNIIEDKADACAEDEKNRLMQVREDEKYKSLLSLKDIEEMALSAKKNVIDFRVSLVKDFIRICETD